MLRTKKAGLFVMFERKIICYVWLTLYVYLLIIITHMGFTDKYNQLIIIIITFFLILSKFNNSAVVTNAPPSICNGKTHNVDNEAKNIYGLQCKNDGTHDCIVCFESSNIVISKNLWHGLTTLYLFYSI